MKKSILTVCLFIMVWVICIPVLADTSFSDDPGAIEQAAQSVLMLKTFDSKNNPIATGSGFLMFDNMTLVTNYHVIEDAYTVIADSDDGYEYFLTKVLIASRDKDIAILRFMTPTVMQPLEPSTQALRRAEKVVAIGSPIGLRNTVSIGNVSAVYSDETGSLIQFTAPISHGSSGGALFNDAGKVIGITSAGYDDAQNINLAIGIAEVLDLYSHWDGKTEFAIKDKQYAALDSSPALPPLPILVPYPTEEITEQPLLSRFSVVYTDTFDTVISLIGFAENEDIFNEQADYLHQLYVDLHKLFDCYNSYEDEGINSIYTVNNKAPFGPVAVDPVLFTLLKYAKEQYGIVHGQTNIAMGSVLSIWHEYREAGLSNPSKAVLPSFSLLSSASEHTDINDLILDEENMTVTFADPDLRLDIGAVAKGYATEIAAQALLAGPMPSFIISAGGNVRIGNPPADGRANWGVGIQDPDSAVLGTNDVIETLYLHDCSVVTSGDYQRYYTVQGTNYHHVIDPDTLMPGNYYRSVSIITEDSGYADLLSTAAFLMPFKESRSFIESLDDVDAIWVFDDGHIEMTNHIKSAAKSHGARN